MRIEQYILIIILIFVFSGCAKTDVAEQSPTAVHVAPPVITRNEELKKPTEPTEHYTIPAERDIDPIEEMLSEMTLKEKLGQMFICAFRRDGAGEGITDINAVSRGLLQDYGIAGVVFFRENITSIDQTKQYIENIKAASEITPFIAIDEEGGRIIRTAALGFEKIPSAQEIGAVGDINAAYEYAEKIASYLNYLGFNLDFAPVADVNSNPRNPVIGDRAFGHDADKAGEMVSAFVKGLEENGVCSALKHFPGHGDTTGDSHYGIASVNHDLKRLESVEFIPFIKGIEAGASFVMVGHISTPEITGNYEPAIFSHLLIEEVLRKQMGFEGVIITDALDMGAVTERYNSAETAVKAVKAGVDVLLMPQNFEEAYQGLLDAVESGEISEQRIDESVRRILKVKEKSGILKWFKKSP